MDLMRCGICWLMLEVVVLCVETSDWLVGREFGKRVSSDTRLKDPGIEDSNFVDVRELRRGRT